ncbi:MAG: hypothetical protein R6V75_11020, partial [Bacteroidales bacterium]
MLASHSLEPYRSRISPYSARMACASPPNGRPGRADGVQAKMSKWAWLLARSTKRLTNSAGSITAALFVKRFVERARCHAHFDIFAWTPSARPGRPFGGE